MKSVLDFLGVDVEALRKEKRTILIYDVDLIQQHMLLRLATRNVGVGGFYINDFVAGSPHYVCNKTVYNKKDIEHNNKKFLLLECKNNSTPPPRGNFPQTLKLCGLPRLKIANV